MEKSRLLSEAAELEDLVFKKVMTTYIARRILTDAFPHTNTVSCVCKKRNCFLPCKLSAIKLIKRFKKGDK